jgi:hypothetical protein
MYLTHVFLANCLGHKFGAVPSATFIQKYQGQTSEDWCSCRRNIRSKLPRTDVILLKIYLVTALNNTFRWTFFQTLYAIICTYRTFNLKMPVYYYKQIIPKLLLLLTSIIIISCLSHRSEVNYFILFSRFILQSIS